MPSPYEIRVTADDGVTVLSGEATFPDPANRPSDGPPFQPAAGDDIVLLKDSNGDPLIFGGDDSGGPELSSPDGTQSLQVVNEGVRVAGGSGQKLGFFGTNPAVQPTVAAADAASIIAALAGLGLIIDGT